jgi:hypothetical protein
MKKKRIQPSFALDHRINGKTGYGVTEEYRSLDDATADKKYHQH